MHHRERAIEKLLEESSRHKKHGEYFKYRRCVEEALRLFDDNDIKSKIRCRVLLEAARSCYFLSHFEESIFNLEELGKACCRCQADDGCSLRLETYIVRANILRRKGKFETALEVLNSLYADGGLERFPSLLSEKLLIEGACLYYLNNTIEAEERLEAALGIATRSSNSVLRSRILMMLGLLAQGRGHLKTAVGYFERAESICRSNSDLYGEAAAALNTGIVLYRRGKLEVSARRIGRAKSIFEKIGWNLGVCRCFLALGNVKKYRREFASALRLYRRGEKLAGSGGYLREGSLSKEFIGDVYFERGNFSKAESYYTEAMRLAESIAPEGDIVVEVTRRLGELYMIRGDVQEAAEILPRALMLSRRLREKLEEGCILRVAAGVSFGLGKRDEGKEQLRDSVEILKAAGFNFELSKTQLFFAEALLGEAADMREKGSCEISAAEFLEEEAWKNLVEAGSFFGEIEVEFWSTKIDRLLEETYLKRKMGFRKRRYGGGDGGSTVNIKYSSEYIIHDGFIAVSLSMARIWEQIQFSASFKRPVLVTGETGTGKELVAQMIHAVSDRAGYQFVAVNCAAVPDHLFESEFFGHRKGCFTGAMTDRRGIFEEANGGTLFLDEVGELSTLQQVKLLRVLQECKIRRVGENVERPVNARIISATNQDIEKLLGEGTFREDFYYRINAEQIHVPALRERPEDLIPLIAYYLCRGNGWSSETVSMEIAALKCLQRYSWPGNVRELFAVLERVKHICRGNVIGAEMLPERLRGNVGELSASAEARRQSSESDYRVKLRKALSFCNGNKSAAAKWLGISRGTLYKELKRKGLGHLIHQRSFQ